MSNRVVVTGIGLLSPIGRTAAAFFRNALNGVSAIRRIQKFDVSNYAIQIGGELLCAPDAPDHTDPEISRVAQWTLAAARQALEDAAIAKLERYAVDIVTGLSISGLDGLSRNCFSSDGSALTNITPEIAAQMNPAGAAVQISRELGIHGEAVNVSTACSSSTSALGYAFRLIKHGESQCVLAGGADEGVSEFFFNAFQKGMSHRNGAPEQACRPFDRGRDGVVVGDAACMLVLESYEHARARDASIYCELSGYGATSDAISALKTCKSEEAGAVAVQRSLASAGRSARDVDYYCAMGMSHPFLDIRETRMLKRVFQEDAKALSVSSIKSMTGHPLGAAGAVQAATCALAIKNGAMPPTINYVDPDPECDLDYIPNTAREKKIRNALTYTLGNGGANAALLFSAC